MPGVDEGCGAMGNLIAMVVTIAVTVISGNPMLGNLAGAVHGQSDGQPGWHQLEEPGHPAIAGQISNGLEYAGVIATGNVAADAVLTQMAANALTQTASVALGLQDHFDWRSVSASGSAGWVMRWVRPEMARS